MQSVDGEIFVVDNNSIDGSCRMVKKKFPEVILIENKENTGFSKANNQAIRKANGEYILLLNPDTVVEDDTFTSILEFMDGHPEAGALGVKMVDGSGKFLPESKRGLPTPLTAFYKMFGLSSLFPRSKRFSKYHMGFLDENEIHEVEILAGAFMLLRKTVLDKIGLLDETFFMYGEDIDLSYRVTKEGYKNYYFPKTRIIHYKGESTKKSSVNYVLVFYNAMVIFAKKHFTNKNARIFTQIINIAIYFRAFLAILSRLWERFFIPVADAILLYSGIFMITKLWEDHMVYAEGGDYPPAFFYYVIPAYITVWLLSIYFSGGYDKPVRIRKSILGILVGSVVILVLYALLPEYLRFSRAIILFGTLWGIIAVPGIRLVLYFLKISWVQLGDKQSKRFIVIGDKEEGERVSSILKSSYIKPDFIGLVSSSDKLEKNEDFIGNLSQVIDIIRIYQIDEVIFCSKSIAHQTIIDKMTAWKASQVDYKIAPENSLSIIGSNSIHTRGDLYTVLVNSVEKPANKRNKRLFDVFTSLFLLPVSPILIFIMRKPFGFIKNIFSVLFARKSWVGFYPLSQDEQHLPKIKKGVLTPLDGMKIKMQDEETLSNLNMLYARDYNVWKDLNIVLFAFRELGK